MKKQVLTIISVFLFLGLLQAQTITKTLANYNFNSGTYDTLMFPDAKNYNASVITDGNYKYLRIYVPRNWSDGTSQVAIRLNNNYSYAYDSITFDDYDFWMDSGCDIDKVTYLRSSSDPFVKYRFTATFSSSDRSLIPAHGKICNNCSSYNYSGTLDAHYKFMTWEMQVHLDTITIFGNGDTVITGPGNRSYKTYSNYHFATDPNGAKSQLHSDYCNAVATFLGDSTIDQNVFIDCSSNVTTPEKKDFWGSYGIEYVSVYGYCSNSSHTSNVVACNSYTSPSGKYMWTKSGTYKDTIANKKGCDSLITINLTINTVNSSATVQKTACNKYVSPSGKYIWISSGTYNDTISNSKSCDSIITTNLTINKSTNASINSTVCNKYKSPSGKYTWTVSGTYKDTIPNSAGCDSIIAINLNIKRSSNSSIAKTACNTYTSPSGKYTWTVSGTYKDTIPNSAGCDSLISLSLTIVKPTTYNQTKAVTICSGSSYTFPDGVTINNITTKIIDTSRLTTKVCGLDSIIITTVNVKPVPTLSSVLNRSIQSGNVFSYTPTCALTGATYKWQRATTNGIMETGTTGNGGIQETLIIQNTDSSINVTYTYTVTVNGCYSVENLVVSVVPASNVQNNISYNVPGVFIWTVPTCVETVTVQTWGAGGGGGGTGKNGALYGGGGGGGGAFSSSVLNIVPGTTYSMTVGAGGSSSSTTNGDKGGDSWFGSQSMVMAKGGGGGADSSLQFNAGGLGGAYTAGSGQIRFSGGNGAYTNGAYPGGGGSSAGYTAKGGNAQPTNPPPPNAISLGGTAPKGGGNGGASGAPHADATMAQAPGGGGGGCSPKFFGSYLPSNGADGQVNILFSNPLLLSSPTSVTTCSGTRFFYAAYDSTGSTSYSWTRKTTTGIAEQPASGTDTINEALTNTTDFPVYVVYKYTQNNSGCSQNVIVKVNPVFSKTITTNVCSGGSYTFPDGTTQNNITTQVIQTSTFKSHIYGCDSTIVTTVNVNPTYHLADSAIICSGSSYTFHDGVTQHNITSQVVHTSSFKTIGPGCDSLITTKLIIRNTTGTINVSSCNSYTSPSGKYIWTTSGTRTDTIPSSASCDSVITINLIIKNSRSILNKTTCNSYTSPSGKYIWTTSETYNDTIANSVGCDSVITINLTVNHTTTNTISPVACKSYTSPSGKYMRTTSGIFYDTIANSAGCDSVITINLTVNHATTNTISPVACNSYTSPSGKYTRTTSGIFYDTIPNSTGCDSVININLTVNPLPVVRANTTSSDTIGIGTSITLAGTGAVNYIWSGGVTNGIAFTPAITTTYAVIGTDTNNCSNTDTVRIVVNPLPNKTVSVNGTTITSNQMGATYQWLNCTGTCTPISGATNQNYTATSTGSYEVIISLNGVTDTSAKVDINIITGITGYSLETINVYPNPSTGIINIQLGQLENAQIKVCDILGKNVYQNNSILSNLQIDLSHQSDGVYFISIQTSKGIINKKIVINR